MVFATAVRVASGRAVPKFAGFVPLAVLAGVPVPILPRAVAVCVKPIETSYG